MSAPIQKSAAKTKAAIQVVTANRLDDGVVVYLDASGGWSERLAEARVISGSEDLEAATAIAKRADEDRVIVEAYPIDVRAADGRLQPLRLRERIRAEGPSVREDLLRPTGA